MVKKGYWNRIKVEWYERGLKGSGMAKAVLTVMRPKIRDAVSILDVGSGCGTLTIPLARGGKDVTALDPSEHMLKMLKKSIQGKQLQGKIKMIHGAWGEKKINKHDVVLCANVPELLKDSKDFLIKADSLARKYVFLITSADPHADKFYYKELYPLIFNREFYPRTDYLSTYNNLHSLGIFANVSIIEYDFDQPFNDLEEAVCFWKEYMGIVTEEHDKELRTYLKGKLKKTKKGMIANFHKKSAVIWWEKKTRKKN